MKTKKDLGIIIPYINLSHYILKLIDTIVTKYSHHIYLIDNNSDKETKGKLEHLAHRSNVTIIYNNTNIGCASSWNQGIKIAVEEFNVDYVAILNNDTLLHKDCLNNMIKIIKEQSFPLVSAFDVCKECAEPRFVINMPIPKSQFIVDAPDFSCYILDIKVLNKLKELEQGKEEYPGLFDQKFYPAYFEDNDFHYRIKLAGMRAVKTNSALYYHFGSRTVKENEEVGLISNTYYLTNRQRFIDKWGGKPGKEKFKTPFNN